MKARGQLVSVRDLTVSYYSYRGVVRALQGVNMDVYAGETVGLVGETGCGKSTLGMAIAGLVPRPGRVDKGEIFFEGEDLLKKDAGAIRELRRKKISVVFQDPNTSPNPVLRIGDQVAEAIMVSRDLDEREAVEEAIKMLSVVGIPDPEKVIRQYPHELSGGMKQRVVMAIGLSKNPTLLIADEPTSSLDVTIQAQVLDLIMHLRRASQLSVILITHNMGLVAQACDRVVVMYAGNVVEIGTVKNVLKRPKHPYTTGLLESVALGKEGKHLRVIRGSVPDLIELPPGCCFEPRCNFAMNTCNIRPKLIEVEPGHFSACHLHSTQGVRT